MVALALALALLETKPAIQVNIFLMEGCPIARKYAPEIERLHRQYRDRGVEFVLMHVDPGTDAEDAKAFAKEFKYSMPFKLDLQHAAAKKAGVTHVPSATVSRDGKFLYVGRIDDRFPELGVQKAPKRADLRIAIDEVLAGRAVEVPRTKVVGCVLPTL